jgi:hypothetical protein
VLSTSDARQQTEIPIAQFGDFENGAVVRLHFYISSDQDAERCRQSLECGQPIAIGGTDTLTGRVKSYSGVVLSMESAYTDSPGEHWRVTIDTGNGANALRSVHGP